MARTLFIKKNTDYDQEKKSTVAWHRDLYLRFGDSNPAKGEGRSLATCSYPEQKSCGGRELAIDRFCSGGNGEEQLPIILKKTDQQLPKTSEMRMTAALDSSEPAR